jgi:FMN phosphatase YigB (HAD superfamily)
MKKIVTDCDGVLLDWVFAFDVWMAEQGYLKLPDVDHSYIQRVRYGIPEEEAIDCVGRFNESGAVGFLPPFRDAQYWVRKLGEEGWRFDVASSLHIDKYAQKLRYRNLVHIFGDVFDKVYCGLDFTEGKLDYLSSTYKDTNYYWIEDSVSHAESGEQAGMRSIVMDHPYNKRWQGLRVSNWQELYEVVNGNSTH